jgi:hypothetical protein
MEGIIDLLADFQTQTPKQQLQTIPKLIEQEEAGFACLRDYLKSQQDAPPTIVTGKILQVLTQKETSDNLLFISQEFPDGIVPIASARGINYQELQDKLIQKDYQAADLLTMRNLCELAGELAMKRKWLYFTEVDRFPVEDLQTIDQLWYIYSEGKFGFSVQRQLWLSLGKDFNQLWEKISWRDGNKWARYPNEFIWNLNAPVGHLPTSNQLRGAKVIMTLFNHPAWHR